MDKKKSIICRYMDFIIRHAKVVLAVIALLTIFFIYQLPNIRIDANVFSYMSSVPEAEFVTTPGKAPDKAPSVYKGSVLPSIEKGEIAAIPERNAISMVTDIPEREYVQMEVHPTSIEHSPDDNPGFWDGYVIIFSSPDMFSPEVLNRIYEVRRNLSQRWEIGPCLSPFDYVTVEKKGSRLQIVPMSPVSSDEAWTEESSEVFKERLLSDSIARNYLSTEDGSTIMLYYRAKGLNETAIEELNTIVNPLREYGHVALNGGGLINNAVMDYINKDLIVLLVLCFLVILLVYYLSFRSMRAMLIPASLSMIGIIWTLGAMAFLGFDLTIVTILTPCLVLTLGSSYSIHTISEYFDAVSKNEKDKLSEHFEKVSKTIFFAMLTTVAGFLSFLICRTEIFKEFGITISIGVFFCALLAFSYLPAILSVLKSDLKKKQIKTIENGFLTSLVHKVAILVTTKWKIFIVILLVIVIVFAFIHDDIGFDSNYMSYFPRDSVIAEDSLYFARTLGGTDPYYFTIRAPEGESGYFLKHENLADVYAYECAILSACPDIVQILSFSQYVSFLNKVYSGESGIPESNGLINLLSRTLSQIGNQIGSDVLNILINEDASEITLSMRNYDSVEGNLQSNSSARRLETVLDYYRYMLPEGTSSKIWCGASNSLKSIDIIMEDQSKATGLSLLLILLFTAIAFRSVRYGLISLVPIMVGVMINYIFMWIFSIPFDMVTVGFSSIAMGAGVDDAIHFIIRYRMKQKANKENLDVKTLLYQNMIETGRPIILTTISVDSGLLMLLFASFIPVKIFGLLMIISLSAAMIATLTVLPPVLLFVDYISKRRNERIKKIGSSQKVSE